MMLYPLTFQPIFKERIWGGRNLARLFTKSIASNQLIGESWEITDRPEAVSVVRDGFLAGKDLRWLMMHHSSDVLGSSRCENGRFPLLIKILDARQTLSVQVHPPVSAARRLNGEPKTELWHIVDAAPGARLYAGLRSGVSRAAFETAIQEGSVADCLHSTEVRAGDSLLLPSGRVHAIGAGIVIFEIQQNSDTTYRVFDWNRLDSTGKPRDLHIPESLEAIDFSDFEPALIQPSFSSGSVQKRQLASCPHFGVREYCIPAGVAFSEKFDHASIVGVVSGSLEVLHKDTRIGLEPGQFCLLPGSLGEVRFEAVFPIRFLIATAA
ncbi:MAG: class I mannose-6-phosphate isomerase [Verrucomicrobia bacterium]|nr:class I mannose-6-phosphate isomerase [Verrucomicrobiota bacterium]